MTRIPVYLITGLLGSGKTTCLRHLLTQKPDDEQWGVLVNEFGEIDIDGATLAETPNLHLYRVSGGCLCCTAQWNLSQALTQLSQVPLDRLFIEPTGLGHPSKILDTLSQFPNLQRQRTLCVITPKQLTQERWEKSAVMRDLVTLADQILLNKVDLSTPSERANSQALLAKHAVYPLIQSTEFARINLLELLRPLPKAPPFRFQIAPAFRLQSPEMPHAHQLQAWSSALPAVEQAWAQYQPETETLLAIGWQWSPQAQFNRVALKAWFALFGKSILRAKGLLRTGNEWQLLNYSEGQLTLEPIAWRKDSRLECLFDTETPVTPADLIHQETQLAASIILRQ
ncbi:MAG: GTP-binding protein [Thiotrichales bacterium]|nr:GTP-binding protein [Thiotrichales bacterium]